MNTMINAGTNTVLGRILCFVTSACVTAAMAHAQFAAGGWTNRYNGPGNKADIANAIAVDQFGNVIVTGYSKGSGSDDDYATILYSAAGVPVWTNRYNGPGNGGDQAEAVTVDAHGDVFVTGRSFSVESYASATIKYSGSGVPLWTNRWVGGSGAALAVDLSGNVVVTGTGTGNEGYSDFATVKYSGTGAALWTNYYSGPLGYDRATAMASDASGNVIVTGVSSNDGSDVDYATIKYSGDGVPLWTNHFAATAGAGGGFKIVRAPPGLAVDTQGNVFVPFALDGGGYVTVKYSDQGVPVWTNRFQAPGIYAEVQAIRVDSSGSVLVAGTVMDEQAGYLVYLTAAYSNAGNLLWSHRYEGPDHGENQAQALAVDESGNVFVTGWSSDGAIADDYATIMYSNTGVPLWAQRYNGPGNSYDRAYAAAIDANGNVIVTGISMGKGSDWDYATIKYPVAGGPWLTVARTASDQVAVSWPSPFIGFNLQQNTNGIATSEWSALETSPADDGVTKTAILSSPAAGAFYRLSAP
ncbi:MAG: hypothetical protein JNL10_06355 [Verrucomicrobiales bacterium]|nr:hypothetical protein [Verrucomicrobiales bacterium]